MGVVGSGGAKDSSLFICISRAFDCSSRIALFVEFVGWNPCSPVTGGIARVGAIPSPCLPYFFHYRQILFWDFLVGLLLKGVSAKHVAIIIIYGIVVECAVDFLQRFFA